MLKNKIEGYTIVKCLDTDMYKIIKTESSIKNGEVHKMITELVKNKNLEILRGFLNETEYDNFVDYPNHKTIESNSVWEYEF